MRIAPDSNNARGAPPGPWGSRMAGILPLGLSERNAGDFWSLESKLTRCGSYGRPVSSSMIETFTPLGVGSEYSWMRSGCRGGHFWVMGRQKARSSLATPTIVKSPVALRLRSSYCAGEHPLRIGYDSGDLID